MRIVSFRSSELNKHSQIFFKSEFQCEMENGITALFCMHLLIIKFPMTWLDKE